MSDSIFLLNPTGGGLVEMVAEPYDSEDVLQRLLEQHPSLLAGAQMRPEDPRRWLLVQREAGVADRPDGPAQWSVDHLFVCQDAVPTIIEVKRASDTRIRREVVGQMLDYAANGVLHWPDGRLRELHAASARVDGADPNDAVLALIGSNDPADVDRFWEQVDTNLRSGRVRMVFVADEIPDRLRRIVEFLNEAMTRAEVFAVAVPQYNGKGHQALVPRLIGNSTRAQDAKRARSRSDHPGFAVCWRRPTTPRSRSWPRWTSWQRKRAGQRAGTTPHPAVGIRLVTPASPRTTRRSTAGWYFISSRSSMPA